MRKLFALALCGLGLLALGSQAQATPLTGEVHFAGLWNPTGGSGIGTATGIDFTTAPGFQIMIFGTGDFALPGTGAAFQNFDFLPVINPSPVLSLWSFSSGGVDYSFDLESVAVAFQSGSSLNLTGSGTLHATGFDDTPADWDFTGNSGSVIFSFSADNLAVPEPATLGLLGVGLVGLTAAGNKRARRIA